MQTENEEECVLCCREIAIYATGICDHPVCYECSARMRVLCETNECPICRSDMPLVVFTNEAHIFSEVFNKFSLFDRRYNIRFENEKIRKAFDLLLTNKCPECEEIFYTFDKLKEHVRRKHELHYCDLCSDSLKIFTFERKCYNRQELALHKRKGDPDNTSHRGHPLCEFCDLRYVDFDDLYRHLRREHFFCHFCDADGLHQYYKSYDYLRVHFRTGHYLCEEGDCADEKFTAAFRTEIDLKAHKATQHSKNKTKAEARQARTLEFEFNYVPHANRPTGSSSPRGRRYGQQRRNEEQSLQDRSHLRNQPETEPLNTQSTQEFPYLSEDSVSGLTSTVKQPVVESTLSLQSFGRTPALPYRRNNMMSAEDFPALGSSSSATVLDVPVNQNKKIENTHKQNNAPNGLAQLMRKNDSAHTSENSKTDNKQNGRGTQATPKWISRKDNTNFEEAFPKLETKKTPLAAALSIETKTNSVQNYPLTTTPAQQNSANNSLQTNEDQFIVIKNKSKKKKQKAPISQDEDEEEENFNEKKLSDSVSSFSNYCNLNNQENKDPYIRRMAVPPQRESDTWETTVSFGKDDFPPLEVMKKPPPGLSVKRSRAPPPGFTPNSNINSNSSSLSMSSIARIVEKSLNSNLNSESVNGVQSPSQMNPVYQEPPNCQFRNEKLIDTINSVSRTAENFEKFKSVSRNFRCSTISASDYYSKCLEILGDDGFQDIFPELVSLLPDISKQQELLAVHDRYYNRNNKNARQKNKSKDENGILSCKSCNQVLLVDDCKSHNCIL